MLRSTCEHKHTNMHSNKYFQLSSLVLFSNKKVAKKDFISPFSSRCSAKRFCLPGLFHIYNRICEDFKFLTNVCRKHDVFLT